MKFLTERNKATSIAQKTSLIHEQVPIKVYVGGGGKLFK